jgi:hypothetical protein
MECQVKALWLSHCPVTNLGGGQEGTCEIISQKQYKGDSWAKERGGGRTNPGRCTEISKYSTEKNE